MMISSAATSVRGAEGGLPAFPVPILKVTLKLTMEEIATGVSKKIKIKKQVKCTVCNGTGAESGTATKTCPVCHGSGEVKTVSRSVFGQFVNITACSNCNGEGTVVEKPCKKCMGDGRVNEEITLTIKCSGRCA